jgi:broad-specificity NMP kinase
MIIDGSYTVCPDCGYKQPFLKLPLLIITGASGTGKSTVMSKLLGKLNNYIILESDILVFIFINWNLHVYLETWLRICKNISQSGKPVILFGGLGVPNDIMSCVEKRYFSAVYYLALVCDNNVLEKRLLTRPVWMGITREYINQQTKNNSTLKKCKSNNIEFIDTTSASVEETADAIIKWSDSKYRRNENEKQMSCL